MLRFSLLVCLCASLLFFCVCVYGSSLDWRALGRADAAFRAASAGADLRTLFVLEARQNAHRINLFADVVWALLCSVGSVLCAIGIRFEKWSRAEKSGESKNSEESRL